MGLDVELEFDKYCKVVQSPKVDRTSNRRGSRTEERIGKGKPTTRGYLVKNVDDEFTEISFCRSRSPSYKSLASGPARVASNETFKREYQWSNEVQHMKKTGAPEVRRKIELSPSSDPSLSFRVFNSLYQPDKANLLVDQDISSMLSLDAETKQSVNQTYPEADPPNQTDISFCFSSSPASIKARKTLSDESIAIPLESENRKQCPAGKNDRGSREQLKITSHQIIGSLGSGLSESDKVRVLHKSSSEKVGMPYSPSGRDSDYCKASGKSRFSPFRRMFDPIMKSKSMRSSSVSTAKVGNNATVGLENTKRNRTLRKSLLNDFSKANKTEFATQSVKKDQSCLVKASPAHLHGHLSLELKHGAPYFEFSLKDPEDILSSKTWRANNTFNWVYTFHSMSSKRMSNGSGWGTRERRKESSMVGQMQVSCFFLSEMRNSGAFNNSMVTEFVLYDIMHAKRALAAKGSSHSSAYSVKSTKGVAGENLVTAPPFEPNDFLDVVNNKFHTEDASDCDDFNSSNHYPWTPVDLHPNLEIAAIVIQVPFEKRESLKEKRGDKLGGNEHVNLFDFSAIDQRVEESPKNINCVKVVTPTGTHGLPTTTEGGRPSPLLDRWRSGGCCDCGGWDMACPLVVLDDHGVQNVMDHPITYNQQHIELFFQGSKEKIPALTITFISEGQYSVDFHARLSKLQAFSICVAILHGYEASTAVAQDENMQKLPRNSLQLLLDEEVRFLIEAVADKEKKKLPQPNVSPIARA